MKKLTSLFLLFVFVTFLLSGCGKTNNKNDAENGISAWPLTNSTENNPVARPVVSIKIENSKDARPQVGLDKADIVWEEIAEGGISRYIAQFNSVLPKTVSPVRSIRPVDADVVAPEKSIIAASGGQNVFLNKVRKTGTQVLTMDSGSNAFWRQGPKPSPHNVYADINKILNSIDKNHKNNAIPQFSYSPSFDSASTIINTDANNANTLNVHMSNSANPVWKYDQKLKKYKKYEGSTPQTVDGGNVLNATNVLLLKVKEHNVSGHLDPAGNPIPDYELKGTGSGVIATGGKAIKIKWSKDNAQSLINLTDETNNEISLSTGNTFIELVPLDTGKYSYK